MLNVATEGLIAMLKILSAVFEGHAALVDVIERRHHCIVDTVAGVLKCGDEWLIVFVLFCPCLYMSKSIAACSCCRSVSCFKQFL